MFVTADGSTGMITTVLVGFWMETLSLSMNLYESPYESPYEFLSLSMPLLSSLQVGSVYVDAGATAIKVPANSALPTINLTSSIVVSGLSSISTAAPTSPTQPLVISYNVQDRAVPPNKAATVRRRVIVTCVSPEKTCTSDSGSLYCSFGGVCTGGSTSSTAAAALMYYPSDSIIPLLSLNGPSSVTLQAGHKYAPCLGAMTVGCELGATATINVTGDFNSRIIACEDMVSSVLVGQKLSAV